MTVDTLVEPPPTKIPRLGEGPTDVEPSTSFSIRPILSPDLLKEELPLVDFYVLRVEAKRQIGQVVKIVGEMPAEFHHLKRVHTNGQVLLQRKEEGLSEDLLARLTDAGFSKEDIQVVAVPTVKPATRLQSDWARQRWATAFHPNKEIEDLLSGAYFSPVDRENVRKWAQKAEEVGCVVVQKGAYLAEGSSDCRLLGHPVMEMISNLAEKDREHGEYLATDCDVFLAQEPCAMCAMALVHARAARVFFNKKTTNGVLSEGTWQFHLQPSFNHHYKVFQVRNSPEDDEESTRCR